LADVAVADFCFRLRNERFGAAKKALIFAGSERALDEVESEAGPKTEGATLTRGVTLTGGATLAGSARTVDKLGVAVALVMATVGVLAGVVLGVLKVWCMHHSTPVQPQDQVWWI